MKHPIDIIVTCVDMTDPAWQKDYSYWKNEEIKKGIQEASNQGAFGVERERDWDMFPFWFRCVEKNCPWVRNVILVCQRPSQVPSWLDTTNPKLRVVYHEDYIPKELLPTFSTMVIEMFFHRIPGLSENYIVCNDDFYFMKPISEDWFFTDGKPNSPYVKQMGKDYDRYDTWGHIENNCNHIVQKVTKENSRFAHYHLPYANSKSFNEKIYKTFEKELYSATSVSRFRHPKQVVAWMYEDMGKAYKYSIDKNVYVGSKAVHIKNIGQVKDFDSYKMLCVNDTPNCNAEFKSIQKTVWNYFYGKFKKKSSFEKTDVFDGERKAYITFLSTDSYLKYVVALGETFNKTNSKYPLYCCVTSEVSKSSIEILGKAGIPVIFVDEKPFLSIAEKSKELGMIQKYVMATSKLAILNLTQFTKCIYVDSDMMIHKNLDHLFDKPNMTSVKNYAPLSIENNWIPQNKYRLGDSLFCAGMFVFVPDIAFYNKIIKDLPSLKEGVEWNDQNILCYYNQNWLNDLSVQLDWKYDFLVENRNAKVAKNIRPDYKKDLYITHYVRKQYPLDKYFDEETKPFYKEYYSLLDSVIKKYNISKWKSSNNKLNVSDYLKVIEPKNRESKKQKVTLYSGDDINDGVDTLDNWL